MIESVDEERIRGRNVNTSLPNKNDECKMQLLLVQLSYMSKAKKGSKERSQGTTSGSGYIEGRGNQNGGYIEAGGKVTHKPNDNSKIYVEGNINRTQPSKGKGSTGGGVVIGGSIDF
jgi:hypothetical protein